MEGNAAGPAYSKAHTFDRACSPCEIMTTSPFLLLKVKPHHHAITAARQNSAVGSSPLVYGCLCVVVLVCVCVCVFVCVRVYYVCVLSSVKQSNFLQTPSFWSPGQPQKYQRWPLTHTCMRERETEGEGERRREREREREGERERDGEREKE